jgi:hypothetical protein
VGRVGLQNATVYFRATPRRLSAWVRRIEQWVAYANLVVDE